MNAPARKTTSISSLVGGAFGDPLPAPLAPQSPPPAPLNTAPIAPPAPVASSDRPGIATRTIARKGRELVSLNAYVSPAAKKKLEQLSLVQGRDQQEVLEEALLAYAAANPIKPEEVLAALGM